jgi:hypothetical protein
VLEALAFCFPHCGFARFEDEHRIGLVVFAEKELVRRDGHDRAYAEQELEDVGPDSAENGHALQELDPRFLHGRHFRSCCHYDRRRISLQGRATDRPAALALTVFRSRQKRFHATV